jgi:peptide/nickel transport system ATP-binding protein
MHRTDSDRASLDDGPVLSVRELTVEFETRRGVVHAVDGLSFDVHLGETLGVVGESGCGKSVSMLALLGLLRDDVAARIGGQALFHRRDLLRLSEREMRTVRGHEIALIPQNPMTSFNPVYPIGDQLAEAIRVHSSRRNRRGIGAEVEHLLDIVGIPAPREFMARYPHECSGGMRQRAVIAMAMANSPQIIIADEPTTALDVTIQAQVLDVLRHAARTTNAALILITHDLGVIAELADRVVVMYTGREVEAANVTDIFDAPRHPYTLGLLRSDPRRGAEKGSLASISGQPPNPLNIPIGCPFQPRCFLGVDRERCRTEHPSWRTTDRPEHFAACHYWDELPMAFSPSQAASAEST